MRKKKPPITFKGNEGLVVGAEALGHALRFKLELIGDAH